MTVNSNKPMDNPDNRDDDRTPDLIFDILLRE